MSRGFKIANDDHQEVVKIVRDASAQLTNSLHLLRNGELFLNGLKFQLSFSPFCDVASDFREANQLAGFLVRIASMTTKAQNLVPSLRTRQPSASYFPVWPAVSRARCGTPDF